MVKFELCRLLVPIGLLLCLMASKFHCSLARVKKSPPPGMPKTNYSQLFIPLPSLSPFPPAFPTFPHQLNSSPAMGSANSSFTNSVPILVNEVPGLPFCRVGQRFIVNHILYVCHQYANEQRRGFKPFACALRNQADTKLLTRNGTMDDEFFRYKCLDSSDGTLRLQTLNCILNEIEIKPGQSLRRGRSEYLCIRDSQGLFKLMEKQMLHDFCLPGNRNESLMDSEKCPGITIGTIHASFGSGSEVIFDSKLMAIVPREKNINSSNRVEENGTGGKGEDLGENGGTGQQDNHQMDVPKPKNGANKKKKKVKQPKKENISNRRSI